MRIPMIIAATILPLLGFSQQNMVATGESTVSIYGTSNVHDWSEHCEQVKSTVKLTQNGDVIELKDLSFKVQVTDINSGKGTMNNYTYEALKEEDHPTITFKSTSITTTGNPLSLKVVAQGDLTIGGKTRSEKITAACTYSNYGLKCTGEKAIDMTLYDIEPPSVMFGAMTVGKDVEVHYEIEYK